MDWVSHLHPTVTHVFVGCRVVAVCLSDDATFADTGLCSLIICICVANLVSGSRDIDFARALRVNMCPDFVGTQSMFFCELFFF